MDVETLLQLVSDGFNNLSDFESDIVDYKVDGNEILAIDMDGREFRIKITEYPTQELF